MKSHNEAGEAGVLDKPSTEEAAASTIILATLVRFARNGAPLVAINGDSEHKLIAAQSCVQLRRRDVGKKVVVTFDSKQLDHPIVLGVIQPANAPEVIELSADGKHVTLVAQESITLSCGEASITLNRDGKVVIRGGYVVSHASGVNRIRGGSIQLN